MRLHGGDVWGHFAPLFHLVDAFAVYAVTLLGGRHVILPAFSAADALLTIGAFVCCCVDLLCCLCCVVCVRARPTHHHHTHTHHTQKKQKKQQSASA